MNNFLQRLNRNRELLGISDANSEQQGKDVLALDLSTNESTFSTRGEAHEGISYSTCDQPSCRVDRLP